LFTVAERKVAAGKSGKAGATATMLKELLMGNLIGAVLWRENRPGLSQQKTYLGKVPRLLLVPATLRTIEILREPGISQRAPARA
jgi:hypothetical protein